MYIFIAFLLQIMIFGSFKMLLKKFPVFFPEGVLNIGSQALGPDEQEWHFSTIDISETDWYRQALFSV